MKSSNVELSWYHSDIECLCGFLSGKFTGVNLTFAILVGILFSVLFYALLLPFHGQGITAVDMFFHGGEQNRSSIPYITVLFTGIALAILAIKNLKLRVQKKALDINILPPDPNFVLTAHTAKEILGNIHCKTDDSSKFILFDRIDRAISNLQNLGNVSAVSECLKNQADNDDSFLSSSYTVLKGLVWAIPVLGFIGTVVGLADSVGGFGSVVKESSDIERIKDALGGVTGGLGTAFETTLIALVLALIVQMIMTVTMNKEELFLDACADYCHKNIISKMKSVSASERGE